MNGADSFDWTDVAVAQLRTLWAEHVVAAEIGHRMGVSRNAVIGKAHRLGLTARPSPIRGRDGAAPPPARRRCQIPKLANMAAVPVALPPVLLRQQPALLRRHPVVAVPAKTCCWPTWGVRDSAYRAALHAGAPPCCGAPVLPRESAAGEPLVSVYCAEHARVAYARLPVARLRAP